MSEIFMVVGSLNREAPYFQGARGVGLALFRFDPKTGNATPVLQEGSVDNPSFLAADSRSGCIYAISEVFGWHEGTVSAYRFDGTGLRYINKQPSLGSITAHATITRDGRHLLVANYAAGPEGSGPDQALVVYPLRADGGLGAPVSSVAHRGHGPDPVRQERSHPHCARQSPDGRYVLVADLGLDSVTSYRLHDDGQLSSRPGAVAVLPPGSGPRHLVFGPDSLVLVICELDSTVLSFRYAAEDGSLEPLGSVSTLPPGWSGENHPSDIQLSADGGFAYAANRGHDSVAILAVDASTGALRPAGHVGCGGKTPRNLAISPDGRFLLVANQNSDTVSVLGIDGRTGGLEPAREIAVGTPMCIQFMVRGSEKG